MKIKFIDLFAGIGGIRLGLEKAAKALKLETECVFTSEIDKSACKTYCKHYPDAQNELPNDIRDFTETGRHSINNISNFDIMLAGFPCQAFSIAGKKAGFEDTRGTLFFELAKILKEKQPKAFILENVKGLRSHQGGETLKRILTILKEDLGYTNTEYQVLNAKEYGIPQNRERVYILGSKVNSEIRFPKPIGCTKRIKDILEKKPVMGRYYISAQYMRGLERHRKRHSDKGNGFGYEIKKDSDYANAVVIGGMGKERNLVVDPRRQASDIQKEIGKPVNKKSIRRMTPGEWERLQGFPYGYTRGVADAQRYKQLGNAVTVPVVKYVATELLRHLYPTLHSKSSAKVSRERQMILC